MSKFYSILNSICMNIHRYRVIYFTGTPQFQYQNENSQAANQSTGFTGTASVIGWFSVFFLVLKLGGTSEINHPVRHQVGNPEIPSRAIWATLKIDTCLNFSYCYLEIKHQCNPRCAIRWNREERGMSNMGHREDGYMAKLYSQIKHQCNPRCAI